MPDPVIDTAIDTPPVVTPPAVETPPVETPPVETPPAGDTPPADPWFKTVPDNWREQIAGDDEAKLNQLKRVTDPGSLFKNYFEAQETIRSKQEAVTTNTLPTADSTPEQWKEYREANSIPEEATGYLDAVTDGLELGEADKTALTPFFEAMHANNIPSGAAAALVDKYYDMQSAEAEERATQDSVDAVKATQMMKENWQGDFEANKNLIVGMFRGHLPEDVMDDFMGARLANGQALFNNPGAMEAFATMARVINPAATIVPPGDNPMQTMSDRIGQLEGMMKEDGWHQNQAAQNEYLQLVDARDQMKARQSS